MKDRNYYTDLANRTLEKIQALKKESKKQELLNAYGNYVTKVKPQLEESGIEYHLYDNKIESIIRSV